MRTSDFYIKPNSNSLNEALSQKFGEKLDINDYSTAQLEKAANLIENKINILKKGKFNETLESEEFHRLKLMHDVVKTALAERAVSKSQQQAAGAALAAKRKGTTKGLKGASKEMSKMSTKELEKFAGTKHKGLPKKVDESDFEKSLTKTQRARLNAALIKSDPKNPVNVEKKKREAAKEKSDWYNSFKKPTSEEVSQADTKHKGLPKKVAEASKPDFLDFDKDGNKTEPMKKALKDKKKKTMKESYIAIGRFLSEGEEGKAELIMAVKDMVDKFTGWSEDIAQMQAQTAMEMADAIRDEMGSDTAEQFTAGVQPALDAAFQAVKSAREALNNQVGSLTGNAPVPMGAEPEADLGTDMEPDMEPPTDDEADLELDTEAPAEEPTDRAKRESIERKLRLTKILSSK